MQRSVLFAFTLFLVLIGVHACARNPAPPTDPTGAQVSATPTIPPVAQDLAPPINPSVAPEPAAPINPPIAQAPAPLTNPTVAPAPAAPINPTIAQAPAPLTNPTIAPAPAAPINPTVAQAPAPLINPAGAQPDLPVNAKTDQVLDALDETGKNLKDFTAKVGLTEGDPNFGDLKTSIGRIWFQKKGEDDGRIRVTFDSKISNHILNEKIEYLLDNGLLIDRNYKKTNEDRRQVIKPGDKINLLKLGEGPFPLPIGQKKEDVYKEFDVEQRPPDKDEDKDLAGTIHLQLKPKPGARFARRFGSIDIWVNRTTRFPAQIVTVAPDESDRKVTKLTDVQINSAGGLKDSDFMLPPIDEKTWGIHTEKYAE